MILQEGNNNGMECSSAFDRFPRFSKSQGLGVFLGATLGTLTTEDSPHLPRKLEIGGCLPSTPCPGDLALKSKTISHFIYLYLTLLFSLFFYSAFCTVTLWVTLYLTLWG